jgi:hypothetical protein
MQMELNYFNRLEKSRQEDLVAREGIFLAIRQEPEFIIRLYQLDSFYVEFYFHRINQHPVSIKGFTNREWLNSYVDGIDLGFMGTM